MNRALKTAFIGYKQIEVAAKLGIDNSRLSKIVNGHLEATEAEKKALARALKQSVHDLFPEVAA